MLFDLVSCHRAFNRARQPTSTTCAKETMPRKCPLCEGVGHIPVLQRTPVMFFLYLLPVSLHGRHQLQSVHDAGEKPVRRRATKYDRHRSSEVI